MKTGYSTAADLGKTIREQEPDVEFVLVAIIDGTMYSVGNICHHCQPEILRTAADKVAEAYSHETN